MKICLCDVCGASIELHPEVDSLDASVLGIALDLCPDCREWAMHIPWDQQLGLALEGIRRRRNEELGRPKESDILLCCTEAGRSPGPGTGGDPSCE